MFFVPFMIQHKTQFCPSCSGPIFYEICNSFCDMMCLIEFLMEFVDKREEKVCLKLTFCINLYVYHANRLFHI